MSNNFVLSFIFICILCYQANAQDNRNISMKIIESKPSVYITHDHNGKQEPLFEGESENRIWLRLHNNTKLKIFICEFSVSKEYGDVGISYNVERVAFFQQKDKKLPDGYGQIDTCDVFTLPSGKSVLFSLPSEHLTKGLAIKTQFFYGWTGDWKQDIYEGTTNFVVFGNDQLPK